jgi:hypothetical protein
MEYASGMSPRTPAMHTFGIGHFRGSPLDTRIPCLLFQHLDKTSKEAESTSQLGVRLSRNRADARRRTWLF